MTRVARKATRAVDSVIHTRPERADGPEQSTGALVGRGRLWPASDGCVRRFDWLEGATGVRLLVAARHGLEAVRISGEVDTASIDAIENVLLEILEGSPDRVELDLSGVSFLDAAGRQMIERASDYARAQHVALRIVGIAGGPTIRQRG